MDSSSQLIGFSTGALAKGDFRTGLEWLKDAGVEALELSALREEELPGLSRALSSLNLDAFRYVSLHAPSRLKRFSEHDVAALLKPALERHIPIVVHPDIIGDWSMWQRLGNLLLIENLDKRRGAARDVVELQHVFVRLPAARLCFDVAHSRQVDPTMVEASQILREFKGRTAQLHASGLTNASTHRQLSVAASMAITRISADVPVTAPIILETPVRRDEIDREIEFAKAAFSPWLRRLREDVDNVFEIRIPVLRKSQLKAFLQVLRLTGVSLSDVESVIRHLPSGSAYSRGQLMLGAWDLFQRLSEDQKQSLKAYLTSRVQRVTEEFPDLAAEFRQQFVGISAADTSSHVKD